MIQRIKEDKSLVKVFWPEIKQFVACVNPCFAELIEQLDLPAKDFPLYIARYPYGASLGAGKGAVLPNEEGNLHRLLDIHFSNEVMQDLGYGKNGLPLGMVLDKKMEYCLDLKTQKLTLPIKMYKPGEFFSLSGALKHAFNNANPNASFSNTVFSSYFGFAGARSALMLPNITARNNHLRLKYKLNISHGVPKCLYEHGLLFKTITDSSTLECSWKLELLYFSEIWKKNINTNPQWFKIRIYLESLLHESFSFEKDYVFYGLLFSLLQKEAGLKPSPFWTDTAHWLFTIASGAVPGYAPASDDEVIPLSTLQYAYSTIYRLEEYLPIIMIPKHFSFKEALPVYYPLKYPSMPRFSIRMRESATTLADMRGLQDLMITFKRILAQRDNRYYDTTPGEISRQVVFTPYHCDYDKENIIRHSKELSETDNRFNLAISHVGQKINPRFPGDASFLKGCIKIEKNNR